MPKHRKGGRRVGVAQARLETPLPPADIVPGPELVSYALIDTHGLKAQGDMQADTGRIRQGDAGVATVESLQGQQLKKRAIQGSADAAMSRLGMGVD